MAHLNEYMFREYDIRGRESDTELNERSVERIARAYGTFLEKRGIGSAVVGHDNRATSEAFYRAAVTGLTETGTHVIGIGTCLTPMLYWAQYRFKTEGGLMVTASHNPAGWNGVKLACGYSYTLIGDEIQEIRHAAERAAFTQGTGSYREEDTREEYTDDLVQRVALKRPLKVLVNTANGTASFFSPGLFRKLGCEVIEHNTDPDPTYPHYVPNPANVEMMQDTGRKVREHGADIGIAIDADGDRLGVTDEKGNIVWPDQILMLLARLVLARKPGAKIVFDVKVSEALPEDIAAHGGVPIMWKTGHSYIKQKLKEENAALAGELSGHIFFVENFYGFDDANFAACKLLEYVAGQAEPLSSIVAKTPRYVATPAYHAHAGDDVKYQIVEKLTQQFKDQGYRVVDIQGARVYLDEGWGLVRASSNLPALVLRFEAKTQAGVEKIEKLFREKLEQFPEVGTEWESA